ncbi:LysR family transcriptional regulator [Rhizobium sp. PL01]|uniref:LysR family transcriptional regulator n=1 Tax=Rhizobium sp. PL01 TaxID=3085631 RepID=UPI002980F467|nr:LysR family transcriptional regulator [Rhizobium sp. PL01]MDW5318384.1 LysR family transcriptional regulator [Rhizobium sp. PL01]
MKSAAQIASRLTLRHLRLVAAVCREGSLVRASQSLNMSQSAVTKALQEIEALTGLSMFERTNRGVVPTMFGEALAAHSRLILSQLDRVANELSDLHEGNGGRVAIGGLLAASAGLLPQTIAQLSLDRPGMLFRIVEATNDVLMSGLMAGELDLVIGRLPEVRERADIVQQVLIDDFGQVVAGADHPLADRGQVTLSDTLQFPWILPHPQTTLRRQFEKAFLDERLAPPLPRVEAISLLTTRGLLAATQHLAVWPTQIARMEAMSGSIVILPVELPTTRHPIGITTRRDDVLTPATRVFVSYLEQTAQRMLTSK